MAKPRGLGAILLIAAVVVFVLEALGIDIGEVNLIAVGLALGFGSFLV